MPVILHQPRETRIHDMPFPAALDAVPSIDVRARGLVAGGAALTATASLFAGKVTLTIAGGADGERYLVTGVGQAGGERIEAELEIAVLDHAWAMPDGGAPMLSIAAFVARFGFDEVVRMTEAEGARGRIDRDLLTNALVDAQGEVEAEISSRWRIDGERVPLVVETIIADLARARLYPRGAPEGVQSLEKGARRRLERIASGELKLGPDAPPPAEAESPIMFAAGRQEYPDGLAGY